MSILKKASDYISDLLQNILKVRNLSKDDTIELINNSISMLTVVVRTLGSFNSNELSLIMNNYNNNITQYPEMKGYENIYIDYAKKLSGSTKEKEIKKTLGSLEEAANIYIEKLSEISNKIDIIFEEKEITLSDMKLSHIAVLGIIQETAMVAKWASYFISQIVCISSNTRDISIVKYRNIYLKKYVYDVGNAVNNIVNSGVRYSFIKELNNLEKNKANSNLIVDEKANLLLTMTTVSTTISIFFIGWITISLPWLSMLRWPMLKWEDYKYQNYQKAKQTKEWLEATIAMKKADMLDMDHESPEYRRLVKIVESYSKILTNTDAKINEYVGDI